MSPASLASRRTGRWHALLLSPCSLFVLLALPLDAAYCPFLFWQWRWGRTAQLHRPLAGDLKDAPLRHRLDQEVGQPLWLQKIVSGLAQMPRWAISALGCLTS